jgi:hypothetical protein
MAVTPRITFENDLGAQKLAYSVRQEVSHRDNRECAARAVCCTRCVLHALCAARAVCCKRCTRRASV